MNEKETDTPVDAYFYTLTALVALVFITVVLLQYGFDSWAVVPLVGGALGVLLPGTVAPALVLVLVMVMLAIRFRAVWGTFGYFQFYYESAMLDFLLALAALVYLAAHSRLLTIKTHAVPPDARRKLRPSKGRLLGRWLLPQEPTRRSASLVDLGEIIVFLTSLPIFAILATVVWTEWMRYQESPLFRVPDSLWQAMLVSWVVLLGIAVCYVVQGYIRRTFASREESLLYLQDQLWQQTRGEQRRIHRWLTAKRLGQQRKAER
jgi:hypothetical protein